MRLLKNVIAIMCISLIIFAIMPNSEAHAWGNGSSNNVDYPYYGIHDAIADVAYQKLKDYNETVAQWITDYYLNSNGEKWGDYEYSFNYGSDNWLGYTDDPDSYFKDYSNHMYYVHPYGSHDERRAPDRIQQLYDWVLGNLTNWIRDDRPERSEDEHKAAYAAGLLTHYFSDMTQFGHTYYTKQDHEYADSRTYHNSYESSQIDTAFLDQLLYDLNAYDFKVNVTIANPKNNAIQLAEWVNSHDNTSVLYYDAPVGGNVIVGSTYAQMLTDYVSNYDIGIEYLGARGYTQQLYQQTLLHIKAAVGNLTQILYSAYKSAEFAQTESEITINLSASTLTLGSSIEVSGSIIPSHTAQVTLTFIQPDGKILTHVLNSAPTGSYSYTFSPTVAGNWSVRASYDGVTSQIVYFEVNPRGLDTTTFLLLAILGLVMMILLIYLFSKKRSRK